MKSRLVLLLAYLAFWYLLSVLCRIAFLAFQYDQTALLSFWEVISTVGYGFLLDISLAGYFTLLPGFILVISCLIQGSWVYKVVSIYSILISFLFSMVVIIDMALYSYWGFRLDATPLFYMNNVKAMTASASLWVWLGGILAIFGLAFLVFIGFRAIFKKPLLALKKKPIVAPVMLLLLVLLVIPIRGGTGITALNVSSAYFSQKQFANHAAINPVWNVAFSLTESRDLGRKYLFFPSEEMKELVKPLLEKRGEVIPVLKNKRPNVILIIVESLTARAVGVTGNRRGITPNLDSLAKDGLLFDRIFASADRTDKGLAAVLSGYPSLPGSTPLKYQKLTEKLSFLPRELNQVGYETSFIYGGSLEFANYRSYLVQSGMENFISDVDFTKEELASKWGAWDHTVLQRALSETPDNSQQFFKTILTLTSHEPFRIPTRSLLPGKDKESLFLSSLHYTDQAIGDFIRQAKRKEWWNNTLVVIIADHGSNLLGYSGNDDFLRQHIPMIWVGGALSVKDTVVHTLGSQTDLAATLLSQMEISSSDFLFSKNMLSTNPQQYAFYTFNEGFSFLTPTKSLVYNTITNTFSHRPQQGTSVLEKQSKAYLQLLYSDFFLK